MIPFQGHRDSETLILVIVILVSVTEAPKTTMIRHFDHDKFRVAGFKTFKECLRSPKKKGRLNCPRI